MTPLILLVVLGVLMHAARSFAPDGVGFEAAGVELAFGFLLLAAYFGGKLMHLVRAPHLTGCLLVGVIASPFALGLMSKEMVADLRIVNGVAVCLIALTAGGELNFDKMRPLLRTIRAMTVWAILGTAILLTGVIFTMRPILPFLSEMPPTEAAVVSFMLAVALASQSPAVVMALINETKADGPVSQIVLAIVVIADLVIIVLFALASSLTTAVIGGSVNVISTLQIVIWELIGSAVMGVFIGGILSQFITHVRSGASLFVILICVVVAEVGAQLHLDPLIIALTAGVYLQNFSRVDAYKLIHELEAASLPVYLVFFSLAGAGLKLDLLYTVLVPAVLIAMTRGVGFWLGSRRAANATQADPQIKRWAWMGLLPQAGLSLALALLIKKTYSNPETFGTLGEQAYTLVVGVVVINEMVAPILMRISLIKSGEAGKRSLHGALDEASAGEATGGAHEQPAGPAH